MRTHRTVSSQHRLHRAVLGGTLEPAQLLLSPWGKHSCTEQGATQRRYMADFPACDRWYTGVGYVNSPIVNDSEISKIPPNRCLAAHLSPVTVHPTSRSLGSQYD